MKVLLDVCTPVQVRHALPGHEVLTAVRMGWGELENGALLAAAETAGFNLLIICDKNMRYQQNLARSGLAILELWTNHRPTLELRSFLLRRNPFVPVSTGSWNRRVNEAVAMTIVRRPPQGSKMIEFVSHSL